MKLIVPALMATLLATSAAAQQDGAGNGWVLYPPLSSDAVGSCETRLQHAEQQLAKELSGMDYTVTIAAKGVSLQGEPVNCGITVRRSYALEKQK